MAFRSTTSLGCLQKRLWLLTAWATLSWSADALAVRPDGRLTFSVLDEASGQPLAVRLELRDARGRLVVLPQRLPDGAVGTSDGFYFDGSATLGLPRGAYTFVLEAGPEFLTRPGSFTIERQAEDRHEVTLKRRVHMDEEGWLAGDLDVQLAPKLRIKDLELMMRARSVDLAAVTIATNASGHCRQKPVADDSSTRDSHVDTSLRAVCDDRRGGTLLYVDAEEGFDVCRFAKEDDSLTSLMSARDYGALTIAAAPSSWDLPVWVASGKLDAIQILHRHSQVDGAVDKEAAGRPRDKVFFPGKLGKGQYSEAIYHHLLNCGLRLPPVASSGAGANRSPIGANRTYVYCGDDRSPQGWLAGLRAGRVTVTNGPLLRSLVEGHPPGHVFELAQGEQRSFSIALNLAFYQANQVEYLEIIKNGQPIHQTRLDELALQQGRLPPVAFDASGWFCVRAVTNNPHIYQFAATGPYYVQCDSTPFVSRKSVQYFVDWLDDAARHFSGNAVVCNQIEEARKFWVDLQEKATSE